MLSCYIHFHVPVWYFTSSFISISLRSSAVFCEFTDFGECSHWFGSRLLARMYTTLLSVTDPVQNDQCSLAVQQTLIALKINQRVTTSSVIRIVVLVSSTLKIVKML